MAFHRLTVPAYFGGLPGGYDYVNNAVTGTPALADGARASGPNAGTYFVGFGEDARTLAANRGLKALAENTDYLDDLLRRDIALPTRTTDVVAGAPVTSIIITGPGVFLGVSGHPNTQAGRDLLFEILDEEDDEIIGTIATGAKCVVTAVSSAVGSGFSSGSVTLTVSPAIPAGKTYRVYYGTRSNLATMPADFLTNFKIRGAHELDDEADDFFNQVSRRDGTGNVLALIGPILETPDGVRLPASNIMKFGVDVNGNLGGIKEFRFVTFRETSTISDRIATLTSQVGGGAVGIEDRLNFGGSDVPAGVGATNGQLRVYDQNTIAGAIAGSMGDQFIPFSGTGLGHDYLTVAERRYRGSLLDHINAIHTVVVGNGTNTFGHINGSTALGMVWSQWGGASSGVLHIKLKPGTYVLNNAFKFDALSSAQTVILEGSDRDACVIEGAVSDGHTVDVAGGLLVLRNVTLRKQSGAADGGVFVTSTGRVIIENSNIVQQKLTFTNVNPKALVTANSDLALDNEQPSLYVDGSYLDMSGISDSTGAFPLIHILVGDNMEHRGYVVRNSRLRQTDHNSPLKISATSDGISDTRVRNVLFENCNIFLGGTTATSFRPTANSGICWIDPLDVNHTLGVDNLIWRNCNVWANHAGTGTVAMLVRIVPVKINYTGPFGRCVIGRVTIEGGQWFQPESANSELITWVLLANTILVRNVVVHSTQGLTGNVGSEILNYFGGTAADYGNITMSQSSISPTTMFQNIRSMTVDGLTLRNVRTAQSTATNGVGDITLFSPQGITRVRNVRVFCIGGTAAGGLLPSYRIQMDANSSFTGSYYEDVVWDATGITSTIVTNSNYIMKMVGGSVQTFFRRCGVLGPITSGTPSSAIVVTGTGHPRLEDCFAVRGYVGLTILPTGVIDCDIDGGSFSFNADRGVYFFGASSTNFTFAIRNSVMHNNGNYGLHITAPESAWAPGNFTGKPSTMIVSDNDLLANNGGNYIQARAEMTGGSSIFMSGAIVGNSLRHEQADVAAGEFQFVKNGGAWGSELVNVRGIASDAGVITDGTLSDYNFFIIQNG